MGAAGLLLAAAPAPAANPSLTTFASFHRPRRHVTLDQKVLAYAKGELNQKVGSGQCWDLVDSAIRAAGADASGDGSYVFGTPIALNDVTPGDCLRFENVTFKHTDPSGSWSTSDYPHHSAIVASVSGRTLTLLNQNVTTPQPLKRHGFLD